MNNNIVLSNDLSLLQIRYDCETVYSLIKGLPSDGVTALGVLPYYSLTLASTLELIKFDETEDLSKEDLLKIKDIRLKLKVFEDSFGKSRKMILNIDYLQDQFFKNKLRFKFMRNWNINYNLGLYTDKNNKIVGNTQYSYYLFQNSKFLKRRIEEVTKAYSQSPDTFDLNEQTNKEAFTYGYNCGMLINSFCSEFLMIGSPVVVSVKQHPIQYFYADFNTNRKSQLFPNGEDGKAVILFLIHILSTINFLLYVLNSYEDEDYGWFGKVNYIAYYYALQKLHSLYRYFKQNKLLTPGISKYFDMLKLDDDKYLNSSFRSYVMHSKFIDKNGNFLISSQYFDKEKVLFGLVESCFSGMTYSDFKLNIVSELTKISDILSQWLGADNLSTKILN
ncbi:hypothetical protein K5E_11350 [Enterococcus thailandicus]|uniref:hypothetical protein n=1 Tax=Enterococcus thailandicus TaxID=417368 RepID=UPI00244D7DEA|nr:hypothetical protein [Enterococcus thailandicus]GMC02567.1 hypothetical protein K4E_00770 [Enterococcus thailandicus]GMC08996.1 hypothetical protein K5E_11350 [Enterococcus thailandicus]